MAEDKSTPDNSGSDPAQPQPGVVITPGAAPAPQPAQPQPAMLEIEEDTPPPAPESVPTSESAPEPEPEKTSAAGQPSIPDAAEPIPTVDDDKSQKVAWMASEFVAHDKSIGWYVLLITATLLLAALVFFITKDAISVGVVIVAGLLLAVYGAHQPRQLEYVVDNRGIGIGQKYYAYDEFKSFVVVPEGAFSSLVFMPLRRFAVPTTVYYAPDDEERILSILSDHLPLEEHRSDAVDSLMRRIRF